MPTPPKTPPLRENFVPAVLIRRATYLVAVTTLYPSCSTRLAMMFLNGLLMPADHQVRGIAVSLPESSNGCPALAPELESDARQWAKDWAFEDAWAWDVMLHTLAHWQGHGLGTELGKTPEFHVDSLWCPQFTDALFEEARARRAEMALPTISSNSPVGNTLERLLRDLPDPVHGVKAYRDYDPKAESRPEAKKRQREEMRKFWNEDFTAYCERIEAQARRANAGGLPYKEKMATHATWTAIRRVSGWTYERIADWAGQSDERMQGIDGDTVRKAVHSFCRETGLTLKRK